MAKVPAPDTRMPFERILENGLFLSRWLMAPFYVGLVVALGMLLVVFVQELIHSVPLVMGYGAEEIILTVLTLIDLSLEILSVRQEPGSADLAALGNLWESVAAQADPAEAWAAVLTALFADPADLLVEDDLHWGAPIGSSTGAGPSPGRS